MINNMTNMTITKPRGHLISDDFPNFPAPRCALAICGRWPRNCQKSAIEKWTEAVPTVSPPERRHMYKNARKTKSQAKLQTQHGNPHAFGKSRKPLQNDPK